MPRPPVRIVGAAIRASRRRVRLRWLGGGATGLLVALLAATMLVVPRPRLLWNVSDSAPIGLWRVLPDAAVGPGDMVVVRLAQPWRGLAARRHYLPANVPLLKRIAAGPGERVCAFGNWIFVDGRIAAVRLRADGAGRPLPWWSGCQTLGDDFVLLLMDSPASFDSRYVGPVARSAVIGKAVPLWLR